MKTFIAAIALLLPLHAFAQEQLSRTQTFERLSHQLAAMQHVVENSRGPEYAAYGLAKATIAASDATIHADASSSSAVVRKPQVGDEVKLLGREGNWYRVETIGPAVPNYKGWIQTRAVETSGYATATYSSDALFQKLTDMALDIRDEYQNNPYIRISGFDVEIGLPPSVTINFEFKK